MHLNLLAALALFVGSLPGLTAGEPAIGSVPPELNATIFYNTTPAGSPVTLAGLRGRVVLIDFWATWCHPCVEAIPHVTELYQKYKDKGLVVIGHTDPSSQDLPQFIKTKPIPYIVTVGANTGAAYGVTGIPHVFIIAPDGRVAWSGHPATLDEKVITDLLVKVVLPASPAPSFPTPSSSPKVAKIEESITAGKVGAGITALTKLANDKDEATARAASASLGTITVWKKQIDDELAAKQIQGDVYAVAEQAAKLALSFTGCGDAKAYQAMAATAKQDPAYATGKEFQKLAAAGAAEPRDAKFPKLVEAFLKKHPEGFYAEQAKALVK